MRLHGRVAHLCGVLRVDAFQRLFARVGDLCPCRVQLLAHTCGLGLHAVGRGVGSLHLDAGANEGGELALDGHMVKV